MKTLIDDPAVAEKISALMLDVTARLNDSVWMVQEHQGRDGSADYRLAVGRVMGEILLAVLNPLYGQYPDLKPEGFE
ncbi:MAG TPA: hypothetical protein VGP79_11225 [Bryobacteraceae bacterium]|jgi:hypothetical protein|nr:hypothetical protein [Bryobacteraceae bacterium]